MVVVMLMLFSTCAAFEAQLCSAPMRLTVRAVSRCHVRAEVETATEKEEVDPETAPMAKLSPEQKAERFENFRQALIEQGEKYMMPHAVV